MNASIVARSRAASGSDKEEYRRRKNLPYNGETSLEEKGRDSGTLRREKENLTKIIFFFFLRLISFEKCCIMAYRQRNVIRVRRRISTLIIAVFFAKSKAFRRFFDKNA